MRRMGRREHIPMGRVLIMDDRLMCGELLASEFIREGHEVRSVSEKRDAIDVGLEFKPHVLVAEWTSMGGLDGNDVARALLCEVPTMQVVFLTELADAQLEARLTGPQESVHACDLLQEIREALWTSARAAA